MQVRFLLAFSFTFLGISAVRCFAAPGGAGPERPASVAVVELFTHQKDVQAALRPMLCCARST
jgi:hypothetical protein